MFHPLPEIASRADVKSPVLIIGIGNPDRGDDAVGVIVAQRLRQRLPADVPIPNYLNTFNMLNQPQDDGQGGGEDDDQGYQKSLRKSQPSPVVPL